MALGGEGRLIPLYNSRIAPRLKKPTFDFKSDFNVEFLWVPGDTGIKGKEVPDKLANVGRGLTLLFEG